MKETVIVRDLVKTFSLSAKQQKIERTKEKKKVAVDHLSFSANEGEIFGLLGSNGAGKTTTLRILSTLINADSGTAEINGFEVGKNSENVRRQMGFLTSELKLEDFFTPSYMFDFFASLHQTDHAVAKKTKQQMFELFGIDKFAEVKISNLSTGMKQKVSLVTSIVHNPPVIIFDEPTNGLDILTTKVVTDFLKELRNHGKTVIFSTHILDLAEKLCDKVGIIADGKMLMSGTLDEVCAGKSLEDRFFDLYTTTAGGQHE